MTYIRDINLTIRNQSIPIHSTNISFQHLTYSPKSKISSSNMQFSKTNYTIPTKLPKISLIRPAPIPRLSQHPRLIAREPRRCSYTSSFPLAPSPRNFSRARTDDTVFPSRADGACVIPARPAVGDATPALPRGYVTELGKPGIRLSVFRRATSGAAGCWRVSIERRSVGVRALSPVIAKVRLMRDSFCWVMF